MYLIRFFIILIYSVLTSTLIYANGDQCYLSVTINDQTIVEKEVKEYVEKGINLKLDNGLTKNWDIVTKELGYENVKEMIDYHKNHENWSKFKEIFNSPSKFNQVKLISKNNLEQKRKSSDNQYLLEISQSIISKYLNDVKPIPPEGISSDACIYNVLVTIDENKIVSSLTSKDLNIFGESKVQGKDGIQESLLRLIFNGFEYQREEICKDYGNNLNKECAILMARKEIEKNKCWLRINDDPENPEGIFEKKLVAEISTSLISQYLTEVKHFETLKFKSIFIGPESTDEDQKEFESKINELFLNNPCIYNLFPKQKDDSIVITISGPDLNGFGNSKKEGADGIQEAILITLYRSLKSKRSKICQDYGEIIPNECKDESDTYEKQDTKFRIRGFIHNDTGSNYSIRNISYLFSMKEWGFGPPVLSNAGIGQSFVTFNSKSSSGAKFNSKVTYLDVSKTYYLEGKSKEVMNKFRSIIKDILPIKSTSGEWSVTPGGGIVLRSVIPIPLIYDGNLDVSSEYGNYSTDKCFGYSLFGILGMELNEWEALLGFRWSKVEFSDIKSGASNYSISGTNFMFGLGWGF